MERSVMVSAFEPEAVEIYLKLTRGDFENLILMMGMATGVAIGKKQNQLAFQFLKLANLVNKGNLNWTPYEIPEAYR